MEYSGIFTTDPYIDQLRQKLRDDLPGEKAQKKMSPSRRHSEDLIPDPANSTPSGVLLLLFPGEDGWSTVFIERTAFGPHGGQISLPGGKKEYQDQNIIQTSLREAWEEIGIERSKVNILGSLSSLFVPHSNFNIYPVIGFMTEYPEFKKDDNEVQSIITISLKQLFDKNNKGNKIFEGSSYSVNAPYYKANGHIIWGATAMILSEFESLSTM